MIVIYIIFDTTANNNGRRQTSVIKDITHHTTYRGLPIRSSNSNSILTVKHLGKQIGAFYNLFVKYKGFFNLVCRLLLEKKKQKEFNARVLNMQLFFIAANTV